MAALIQKQHGFRPNRSAITADKNFIKSITDNIHKKMRVAAIFLDLSRAFNSVSHPKLLQIMQHLGLDRRAIHWFQLYLIKQEQFVEIIQEDQNVIKRFQSTR